MVVNELKDQLLAVLHGSAGLKDQLVAMLHSGVWTKHDIA